MTSSNILAIDFGTSNSACGLLVDGTPKLLTFAGGAQTIPTSIFFDNEERKILYGEEANAAFLNGHTGRYMRSIKSALGSTLMGEDLQVLGRRISFPDIISGYIKHLKQLSEVYFGQSFTKVLSGRPVNFHSKDEERNKRALADLTDCYQRAGFNEISFLTEPEAATKTMTKGGDALGKGIVIDIGGGTSDFTISDRQSNGIEVMAVYGIRLGGTNFDKAVNMGKIMPLLGKGSLIARTFGEGKMTIPNGVYDDLSTWHKIDMAYEKSNLRELEKYIRISDDPKKLKVLQKVLKERVGHKIANAVEKAKINLSANQDNAADIYVEELEDIFKPTLNTQELNILADPEIEKIVDAIETTLTRATLSPSDINWVKFVGGSSLLQPFQYKIKNLFDNVLYEQSNVFTAVILGLTLATAK